MADATDISHIMQQLQQSSSMPSEGTSVGNGLLPNGKKTKGRVKIKMEYIGNKLRRYTTFSKRKTGIMKKAYELSTLTGTQVMLLVASETGHVYTYATKKLQPMIASDVGKNLIQNCLNSPGEGTDLQPARTEFTFETGSSPSNPRKRKMNDGFDPTTASIASFLPTMVNTPLFSNFNEDDYNQAGDSGDDSDSEEPSETGKEESVEESPKKNDLAACIQAANSIDTIKEAMRIAASARQQQKTKKSLSSVGKATPGTPAFIAPFLLSGLTGSPTNHGTMFQLPQGCVYTGSSGSSPEGGAGGLGANGMYVNSAKTADEATAANPLLSFPFPFNLQQMLESAALGAQIANSE